MGSTQRVIHNTLLLSTRMVVVLLVSLYTVRVTLEILGIVDYGIFNVVGGIVLLLNFLSRTMANATQRFFSYELGIEKKRDLKYLFQSNLTIYLILALIILLISFTVGIWFLNHKMVIPPERLSAANWVFIFAVFSFIARLLVIPYHAILVSHEKMGLFAWLSIIEMVGLLIIVSILPLFSYDRLKSYAVMIFIHNVIINSLYVIICRVKYTACRWGITNNWAEIKTIVSFTGWSLYGSFASVLRNFGTNILLNLFFGPTINAARGIASQAHNAINSFVANFSIALKPQIVKNYANGNKNGMIDLVFQGSKISYFIILFLGMPVLFQTPFFFSIWLKNVPEYTILFTRLVLITAIIDSITIPLVSAIEATGNIKKYQLVSGSMLYLIIPISYFLLKAGMSPETPMVICVAIALIIFILNIYLAKDSYQLPVSIFFNKVICKIITVTIVASLLPTALLIAFENRDGIINFLIIILSCMVSTVISIYLLGLDKIERITIKKNIRKKIRL